MSDLPKLGIKRQCYDNTAPEQLRGLSDELRAKYLAFTYAAKNRPGVRYVRADTFLRAHPAVGFSTESELTGPIARQLAAHFVRVVHGERAYLENDMDLNIAPDAIAFEPESA